MADSEKDWWDKAAVILHPLGGLLAALAVGVLLALGFARAVIRPLVHLRDAAQAIARAVS